MMTDDITKHDLVGPAGITLQSGGSKKTVAPIVYPGKTRGKVPEGIIPKLTELGEKDGKPFAKYELHLEGVVNQLRGHSFNIGGMLTEAITIIVAHSLCPNENPIRDAMCPITSESREPTKEDCQACWLPELQRRILEEN